MQTHRIPKDYVEKVYAGWLGKIIGVRHGANVEGWEPEMIQKIYGEMSGANYLYDFKNFAADDDTNGPYFFVRALEDETHTRDITPQQMSRAWLNYAAYEQGFYCWAGYGLSTEHTAYLNLRSGIEAPHSGSAEQNGDRVANQIGGQIFIDTWGLVIPCDYQLAAEYAKKAASVSHDRDGVYGGMFVAACISAAFCNTDIENVIKCGLSTIPKDCEYAKMIRTVQDFYHRRPENWRECFDFVREKYSAKNYTGDVHIIPNSSYMVLSMLYGQGDFSETINICNMCGWDTDCNVGNIATILGVLVGIDGIDERWRKPIGDLLICSNVLGSLNILDAAGGAYYLAGLGYKVAGEEPPEQYRDSITRGERSYDFELPGAIQSFRAEINGQEKDADIIIENTDKEAYSGRRSLKVSGKCLKVGDEINVFLQTYYYPDDFEDSRYNPVFSPLIYAGQTLSCAVKVDGAMKSDVKAHLYAWDSIKGEVIKSERQMLKTGEWTKLIWHIPVQDSVCFSKAGVKLVCGEAKKDIIVYVDDYVIEGEADYQIDFGKLSLDVWNANRKEINQFTRAKGIWDLEDGGLCGSGYDYAECYTGLPTWRDYTASVKMTPYIGNSHRLLFRVRGAIKGYGVGLEKDGKVALYKNDNVYISLATAECDWKHKETYEIKVALDKYEIVVFVDGVEKIRYIDKDVAYLKGQVGFGVYNGGRCRFTDLKVTPTK